MKREELIRLIRAAATEQGYAFHTGEEHLIGGSVRVYPAAWLAPPDIRDHTGRREGETTFRIVLHLMTLPTGGAEAETVWQTLEKDALSVATALASSPAVCSVSDIRCTPARQSLTAHGEISVALSCDVTIWYFNN
jgi:hypothetical protein